MNRPMNMYGTSNTNSVKKVRCLETMTVAIKKRS